MDNKELVLRIKYLRNRAGLSARELSLRIGKNPAYINRLETGKSFNPTIDAVMDIILVCGSTYEEFFYSDIMEFEKDKEILSLIKDYPKEKKDAFIKILKLK